MLRIRPLLFAVTLLGLAAARTSSAEWKSVQQVTLGTAQVLEQGAVNFGIIAPIAYGASTRLTLQSHPILDLLLVPNLGLRYRIVDQQHYIISAVGSFKRSFGQVAASATNSGALAPGEALAGGLGTWYPNRDWAVTGGLVYAGQFDEKVGDTYVALSHGMSLSAQLHWLAQPSDLIQITFLQRYGLTADRFSAPVLTVGWAHSFRRWLSGAHLLVSVTWNDQANTGNTAALSWLEASPLLPYVDLWWKL